MGRCKITKIIEISRNYSKFAALIKRIMEVVTTQKTLASVLAPALQNGQSIGLVPTMGALHKGHLSLVSMALEENDWVVVSVFVNPTQFNNAADLAAYPVGLAADAALLKNLSDSIIVFAPTAGEMYPEGLTSKTFNFNGLDTYWEGADRPGHFNGVATVVEKLFTYIPAQKAYFGEKDFQQLAIIRQLVLDLNWPIEIVGCPIVREPNGLAMSSRNERLSGEQREQAAIIYSVLKECQQEFDSKTIAGLKKEASENLLACPGLDIHYFEFVNAHHLSALDVKDPQVPTRLLTAVSIGGVRLIDNIAI